MKINSIQSTHFDQTIFPKNLGLIALSTDLVSEQDFAMMNRDLQYGIYTNRVEFNNPITPKNLAKMSQSLTSVSSLITPDIALDSIAFSCTSGSIYIGNQQVSDLINANRQTPSYVTTPTHAALKAMDALKTKKLAVLAPYSKNISLQITDFFEQSGVVVEKLTYLGLETDQQISHLSVQQLVEMAISMADQVDTIFLSCTGLRAVQAIHLIEQSTNLNVITSNQAMFWDAISTTFATNTPYGKLFSTASTRPQ